MLEAGKAMLIIIDVQEKLFRVMHEREALLRSLKQIVQGARELGLPIIWTEQYPEGMGATLPELTELLSGLHPIAKRTFSCCGNPTLLDAILKTGRTQALLVGIESHVCVYQTAIDLLARGLEVEVVADCVSSRSAENFQIGINRIQQAGGRVTSVEMALFEMLHAAEGPHFKSLLKIVK
jgi:Amidases related to nicotinamidase